MHNVCGKEDQEQNVPLDFFLGQQRGLASFVKYCHFAKLPLPRFLSNKTPGKLLSTSSGNDGYGIGGWSLIMHLMISIARFSGPFLIILITGAHGPDHGGGASLPREAGGAQDGCGPGVRHHHHLVLDNHESWPGMILLLVRLNEWVTSPACKVSHSSWSCATRSSRTCSGRGTITNDFWGLLSLHLFWEKKKRSISCFFLAPAPSL